MKRKADPDLLLDPPKSIYNIVKQIMCVDGNRYVLQEIYGIGNTVDDNGENANERGNECVICLSEPRDTTVLPCRHMCMCSGCCAKLLRFQTNLCPICRQKHKLKSLVITHRQISVPSEEVFLYCHLFFDCLMLLLMFNTSNQETKMSNVWYEVLSVLHLMAMLQMSQANLLLLPRGSSDGHNHPKVSEENRRASIDIFLKAAGYLDCAVKHVLPQFSAEQRRSLPVDLAEGVLRALCLQALGQGVDIQLGMAIDSSKATLAVKRRLSCEMVKYWQQAQDNLMNLPLANGWGEKHGLFVKWKYVEAKAAAYYYHGLILDEGNTEKSHGMAVAALQAADECFKESKKASEAFNASSPTSRTPPLFGTMKYLTEKIPKDTSSKVRINRDLYTYEKIMETAPTLPDFALALKPDEYQLPVVEAS